MLGVPGLFAAYRAGRVTLANAIGTGVADDKSIYPHVPDMIRYYLAEEPILNNVPTFMCYKPPDPATTRSSTCPSWWSRRSTARAATACWSGRRRRARSARRSAGASSPTPERYIAQPTLALSTCPTFVGAGIAPRHIDLRPYVLSGADIDLVPGGLTRVALREGSLVVNSSQGGGTKDTWCSHVKDGRDHMRRRARRIAPRPSLRLRGIESSDHRHRCSPHRQRALLFWMARHERAENTARLLDVTYRTSLLPTSRRSRARLGEPWAVPSSPPAPPRASTRRIRRRSRPRTSSSSWCSTPQPVVDLLLPARGARSRRAASAAPSPRRCTRT